MEYKYPLNYGSEVESLQIKGLIVDTLQPNNYHIRDYRH